jgi:hypothetical protein
VSSIATLRHASHIPRHSSQAAELHKKLSQRLMKGGGGDAGQGKGGEIAVDVKRVQWLQLQV